MSSLMTGERMLKGRDGDFISTALDKKVLITHFIRQFEAAEQIEKSSAKIKDQNSHHLISPNHNTILFITFPMFLEENVHDVGEFLLFSKIFIAVLVNRSMMVRGQSAAVNGTVRGVIL